MPYRVTKRSAETLAKMRQARAAKRIEGQAPDYPSILPELRRRIVVTDYDFGEITHTLGLYRTNRVESGTMAGTVAIRSRMLSPDQSAIGALHGYAKYYRRTSADACQLRPKYRGIHAHRTRLFRKRKEKRAKQVRSNDAEAKRSWVHNVFRQSNKRPSPQTCLVVHDRGLAGWSDRPYQRQPGGQQVGKSSPVRCDTESAESAKSKIWQCSRSSWCDRGQSERQVHRSNHAQLPPYPYRKIRHGSGSACRLSGRETGDTHSLHDLDSRVHVDGVPWKARMGWSQILASLRKSLPRVASS